MSFVTAYKLPRLGGSHGEAINSVRQIVAENPHSLPAHEIVYNDPHAVQLDGAMQAANVRAMLYVAGYCDGEKTELVCLDQLIGFDEGHSPNPWIEEHIRYIDQDSIREMSDPVKSRAIVKAQ